MRVQSNLLSKVIRFSFLFALVVLCQDIALASGKDLGEISTSLVGQIESIGGLLIIGSYVAGIGFALMAIVQFKAHKENPTQVQLGKPVVALIVGACLLFLPSVLTSAGQSIFGGDQKSAGSQGTTVIQ